MNPRIALYAAVGATLIRHDVDVQGATLTQRGTQTLPAGLQYAWPHASGRVVYVACSDGRPGHHGTRHFLAAYRVAPDGELTPHGEPLSLRSRPVHVTLDRESAHVLVTFHAPSDVGVYRLDADGRIGAEVPQQQPLPLGKTAHQTLVSPTGTRVFVPVRGSHPEHGRPEEPGSLAVFDYRDAQLAHRQTIAPGDGYGFGPRHIDFHPTEPWAYLSIERQNEIALFELSGADVIGPRTRATTLERPQDVKPRQLVGAIHVHPSGRFVYVSNRADGVITQGQRAVFNGGENSIAVFSIDPQTGEPIRIQNADTGGIHPRTFCIDPTGRLLVAANMTGRAVREGDQIRDVPARLSVFRIGDDGMLQFARAYDVDAGDQLLFWAGMLKLPSA